MTKAPTKKKASRNYVIVTSTSYGKDLKGMKVFFEGKRPGFLRDDGAFKMGKHLLTALRGKFPKFQLTITIKEDDIKLSYGVHRVRISQRTLKRMDDENWDRTKDIKNDIVRKALSSIYPSYFTKAISAVYVAGQLSQIIKPEMIARLSIEDRDAINAFLPDYLASESISSVNLLKATAQIKTLKELAEDFGAELDQDHTEAWWQQYIQSKILLIQQGYIKAIGKMNITIGNTKFPDFSLITHDNYLDILEIKRPGTPLFKHDDSRDNFYWDPNMSKAIVQTEKYVEGITRAADAVRSFIRDEYTIDMKIIRPRGIILSGDTRKFNQKQKDDFRLLAQSSRNIIFVTYDELLSRLKNYIQVLQQHSKPVKTSSVRRK